MKFRIERGKVRGTAEAEVSRDDPKLQRGTCETCGGRVLRSWRTGTLHARCFICRYLTMIYGPNIRVKREDR